MASQEGSHLSQKAMPPCSRPSSTLSRCLFCFRRHLITHSSVLLPFFLTHPLYFQIPHLLADCAAKLQALILRWTKQEPDHSQGRGKAYTKKISSCTRWELRCCHKGKHRAKPCHSWANLTSPVAPHASSSTSWLLPGAESCGALGTC